MANVCVVLLIQKIAAVSDFVHILFCIYVGIASFSEVLDKVNTFIIL